MIITSQPTTNQLSVGIQVGSTNCAVALGYTESSIHIIPNQYGNTTIPLIIAFSKTDNTVIVGEEASYLCYRESPDDQYDIINLNGWKEILDYLFDNAKGDRQLEMNENNESLLSRLVDGKIKIRWYGVDQYKEIADLLQLVVDHLAEMVNLFTGNKRVMTVCFAVPHYFGDGQRRVVKECLAESPTFQQSSLFVRNEMTMTCYPHLYHKRNSSEIICIVGYNAGESYTSVTLFLYDEGIYEMLEDHQNKPIGGGKRFTQALVDYFCLNHPMLQGKKVLRKKRLFRACKYLKESLSTMLNSERELDCLLVLDCKSGKEEVLDLQLTMSRAKFEDLTRNIVREHREFIESIVDQWQIKNLDNKNINYNTKISYIVAGGGMTNMPCIRTMLKGSFPQASLLGVDTKSYGDPSVMPSYGGVSIMMHSLAQPQQWVGFSDYTSLGVGYEANDGSMIQVIPRNSFIPSSRSAQIVMDTNNTPYFNLNIYYGQRSLVKDNFYIGSLNYIKLDETKSKGETTINVKFQIGIDYQLKVWVDSIDYHDFTYISPSESDTEKWSPPRTTLKCYNQGEIMDPVVVDYPDEFITNIDKFKIDIPMLENLITQAELYNDRDLENCNNAKNMLKKLVYRGREVLESKVSQEEIDQPTMITVETLLNQSLYWLVDNPSLFAIDYELRHDRLTEQLTYLDCLKTKGELLLEEVD
ncbi:protein heat shock protein Hsp70 [Cavenderia fasciculata]|uniref:Protein heat shock protein Hsp70 n=1 Tax=Cavenderia fasciculata TaxID=261658 RepID=F4QDZ7_CACFS|nr:protein heat shock protein Hsp70 [Cavenderia fasciculata]EGG13944.1 protein heat shock protein Hsp70 [Cavenderia fasciculata]|eukprot:XP_004350652.1 protein heat shock protein Hsp70 [Cavenderia fasciculata]